MREWANSIPSLKLERIANQEHVRIRSIWRLDHVTPEPRDIIVNLIDRRLSSRQKQDGTISKVNLQRDEMKSVMTAQAFFCNGIRCDSHMGMGLCRGMPGFPIGYHI